MHLGQRTDASFPAHHHAHLLLLINLHKTYLLPMRVFRELQMRGQESV